MCAEAQKIIDWYEDQKNRFMSVKAKVDQFKLDGGLISFEENRDLQAALPAFIDFGRKEQALLLDLWYSKVDQLLASLMKQRQEDEEVISCDMPKYWLEEGQALEVPEKDGKFIQLNELVDDVDNVIKSIRASWTREQVDEVLKFALEEVTPRLCYRRLDLEFEERMEEGDIKQPLASKYNHATPLEFLKWQMKKKTLGEDATDDAVMISANEMKEADQDKDDIYQASMEGPQYNLHKYR